MAFQIGTTHALAAFIAIYFMAAGARILCDSAVIGEMFDTLRQSHLVTYLGGLIAFTLGAVIVSVHNSWDGLLAVIVSLVGWAALIEGVLLLAMPRTFIGWFAPLAERRAWHRPMGGFTLGLGVLLMVLVVLF